MKMKSCLLAILIICNISLPAKKIFLKSSISLSKYQNNLNDTSIFFNNIPTFQIGPSTELPITKDLSISMGLLYTFNGSGVKIKLDSSNYIVGKYITQYLSLPITFNYFIASKPIFIIAGPEISINTINKIKMENGESIDIKENSKKIVFAFNIGIGFKAKRIKYPISIELIFNKGFSSILLKDQSKLYHQEIKLRIGLGIIG